MKLCLLSRFFDLRNAGVGRYSMKLLKRLRETDLEIETVSQDGGIPFGSGMAKYFLYTAFEAPFKIPQANVYHAMTPLESIHAPNPLVVTFHDFIPMLYLDQIGTHYAENRFERWFTSSYFRMACTRAVQKADVITAVSEQTKEELTREFEVNEREIQVIRHGINQGLEPAVKKDDVFRVGTLSFLGPRKRIDLLIQAFLKANVDGELLIGGKGRMLNKLKEAAGGDERVKFLGFVPDEGLKDFYNSLDAFAFPTKLEGYGLPAVEAMACKTPVVTLSDAKVPSDIKNKTIIVDNLKEWLANPDLSEIDLDKNYKFAKSHDWEKCAREYRDIYEKLG